MYIYIYICVCVCVCVSPVRGSKSAYRRPKGGEGPRRSGCIKAVCLCRYPNRGWCDFRLHPGSLRQQPVRPPSCILAVYRQRPVRPSCILAVSQTAAGVTTKLHPGSLSFSHDTTAAGVTVKLHPGSRLSFATTRQRPV